MKPNVIIELQPYLHDFLYHEFGCSRADDGVTVTSANDIGKFIQAMVTVADRPPPASIERESDHIISSRQRVESLYSTGELHLYSGVETTDASGIC